MQRSKEAAKRRVTEIENEIEELDLKCGYEYIIERLEHEKSALEMHYDL